MAAPERPSHSPSVFHLGRGHRLRGLSKKQFRLVALIIIALAVVTGLLYPSEVAAATQLPLLAFFSTTRMVFAYLLSLIFAIAYGTAAAASKRAAGILLPILDVLQSVPILGFFPIVLVFFGETLPYPFGVEIAVIILIFTSMAWNMAFGVYEALTTLPHDLLDASSAFGIKGWLKFRRLQFPATVPKLVYNSILSWTVGWFYLVASEVFTAFGKDFSRPGLGAFIFNAGVNGNIGAILIGLATLTVVVLVLDTFVWRPLSVWAERFRLDVVPGGEGVPQIPAYIRLSWLPRLPRVRRWLAAKLTPILHSWERIAGRLDEFYSGHVRVVKTVRRIDIGMLLVILAIILISFSFQVADLVRGPLPYGATDIPAATAGSLGRLALAYMICLAWTIPAAAWLGRNKRAARFLTPAIEVFASVPATALFPLILLFAVAIVSGTGAQAEVAAFIISVFAMQWYLLFNVLAGVRNIPADLEEASKVFGVRGWHYWRRVLLPAIAPSLLTGSITAWGAGWNALIVAEFIQFGGKIFQVGAGIGSIIDVATYGGNLHGVSIQPSNELLYLAILFMIIVVLAMNKLLWRPLIKRAAAKYRIEIG